MANATSTQLQELYVAYFGRAADPTGLDYWKEKGISTAAFAANMYAQPEFKSAYGSLSTESQVNQIYKNLFDREADVTGLTYWTQQIKLGNLQLAEIATHLIWAAQNNSGSSDDKTALTNRTNAAIAYTAKIKESTSSILAYQPLVNGLGEKDFDAGVNITEAKAFLSGIDKDVTHTDAGIAVSVAAITSNGIPSPAAKTFTLTTGTDTFAGSTGKDVFQGVIVGQLGTGTTITSGDSVKGNEGTDTLNISVTSGATAGVNIVGIDSDVEKILFSNFDTGANDAHDHTFDASLADGVTTVGFSSSAALGDTEFTSLKNIVNSQMFSGAADLTVSHADTAVSGTADSAILTVSGQTAGTFTETSTSSGGLETLNVVSQGSANTVNITSTRESIATVNVTGDKNLTTTIDSDGLKTVDASAFTGKLNVTAATTADLTLKGGSGDDTFTFSANNFTAADSVDGGAGTDILEIATPITAATLLAKVSNVETLKPSGGADVTIAADANVMNFDFTETGDNVLTLNTGVSSAVSVTVGSTGTDEVINSANVELTVKGKADAINTVGAITGGTGTDTIEITADAHNDGAIVLNTRSITNVEKITIVDNGDAAITASKGAAGKDVNITTGSYATALTIDGSALDAAISDDNSDSKINDSDESAEILTVDGSSATKVLTITGGAAGDAITGGTKNDVIDGGAGADTITLTAGGNDNVKGGSGNDKFVFGATLTKDDVVDGGDGTDTLSVTTLTAANLAGVTNVETLAFTGTTTLAADLSFDTIDLTDGSSADKVTFSTGYAKATTVKIDAGDSAVNSAKITMTVSGSAVDLEAADNTVITGSSSTKNDSISITASGEGAADTVATSGLITNVNTITVVDAGDATSGSTGLSGSDFTIDLASYGTALTIDASALDAANKDNNSSGSITSADSSEEKLTITGTSSKALTVTGGAGTDTIIGSSDGDNGDTLKGGAGADTFTMAGNLTYTDNLDGGAGTDILTVTSAVGDTAFMNVSNVETLTVDGGGATSNTLGAYFSASGIKTVNLDGDGGDLTTITASGTTTGITYVAKGTLNESITAGTGDDTFVFDGTGTLDENDSITGGLGTDTIQIDNSSTAGGAVTATIGVVGVTGVEKVVVKDADGGDTSGAENADAISITFDGESGIYDGADTTDETDVSITVDASVITDSNDTVTVDASDIGDSDFTFTITGGAAIDTLTGGGGVDTIKGGGANDVIVGGAGADVIDGEAGDDSITGGADADTLTGGAGKDDFLYSLADSESTQAKTDTITDFVTGSDEIRISLTAPAGATTYDFTNKGATPNVSEGIGLLSATGGSPIGQYVFNTGTNTVILDSDGNGLLQATDFAVKLTDITALADSDVAFDIKTAGTADTVVTGAGNDIITQEIAADSVTTGKGDDLVKVKNVTYTGTIAMGAGTDTLQATAAADVSGVTLSGVEKITIDSGDSIAVSPAQAATFGTTDNFTVTGSGGTEVFTVNDGGAAVAFDIAGIAFTSVESVSVLLTHGDNVTSTIKTGSTADTIALDTGAGFTAGAGFALNTGLGTDIFDLNTTSAVTLAAGTVVGIDTIDLMASSGLTINNTTLQGLSAVTGVNGGQAETIFVTAGSAGETVDASSITFTDANAVLIGNAGVDAITGDTGADYLDGAAGNDIDTLAGGAGNDTYAVSDAGEADIYIEGNSAGTDTILVTADLDVSSVVFGTGSNTPASVMTNFEQIVIANDADATFAAAQLDGLTLGLNTVSGAAASVVTINGTSGNDTIDISGISVGAVTYTASTGESATGTAFNSGDDSIVIDAGVGADTITLESTIDENLTYALGDSTTSSMDTVNNWTAAKDKLNLPGTPSIAGTANDAVGATAGSIKYMEIATDGLVTFENSTGGGGATVAISDTALLAEAITELVTDFGSTTLSMVFATSTHLGDSYVFTGSGAASTDDLLIKLAGVAATGLKTSANATDIIIA